LIVITYETCLKFQKLIENKKQKKQELKNKNRKDEIYQELLNNEENAVNLINTSLNLRNKLDKDDIEKYQANDIEGNIIYRVKEENVYFIIEHEQIIDKSMKYRMNIYANELMMNLIKNDDIKSKNYIFPIIIPIVIYTGNKKCKVNEELNIIEHNIEKGELEYRYNLLDINQILTKSYSLNIHKKVTLN